MHPTTPIQPHQSLGKFILYVIVAIIFFIGGYYIGKGYLVNQGASLYQAVGNTGPAGTLVWSDRECSLLYLKKTTYEGSDHTYVGKRKFYACEGIRVSNDTGVMPSKMGTSVPSKAQ